MTATITIDAAGRCVLPKSIRERLHLSAGAKLKAELIADKIELTPEPASEVRTVRNGKRLVLTGLNGFNAVEAVKAAREAYDERLASRHGRK